MARGRRRWLCVALVAGLGLAAPAAAATPRLLPLHAVRGDAPRIEDSAGRHVLLRGVNVNQLGDYYEANPRYAPTIPLAAADFDAMRALGFDVVRLIVHWSALEPTPGAFDAAYVARIRQAVDWARQRGIYVVLDMHQDAWSKHVSTPAAETCLPAFARAVGFDGAPRWATLTDGLPTCKLGPREIAPAVAQAFQGFWADRDGIQQHLVDTWARLARAFAADPAIAGYDLINEPHPGYAVGAGDSAQLTVYYMRAIAAIRAGEAQARGGRRHVVFFEPSVVWSGFGADAIPAPTVGTDPDVVFSPHLYAESIDVPGAVGLRGLTVEQGFQVADAAARTYATTVWSGEWGWFGTPTTSAPRVRRYAAEEDARRWGGAWWDWKQACGDPHMIGAPGGEPGGESPSLNRFACPSQTPRGIPAPFRTILERPYPRAAPGALDALNSDPDTGAFSLSGRDADRRGSCRLEVWAPARGSRPPHLNGVNARHPRATRYAGGWLISACVRGAYQLRGSFTPT
jgi:endoglycosylceramidase